MQPPVFGATIERAWLIPSLNFRFPSTINPMSTKSSIACGPNFHLYHEAFEQDAVYLELEQAFFEASPDKVTVAIPVVVWEVIRQYAGADLSWAAKSDEEIRQWVEHEVDERIALSQTASANRAFLR